MSVRFLLGPAGVGKTWRCLAEIREALRTEPEGAPLLLLAPKQATFQLERQLFTEPGLPGFGRLHILSFERLAFWLLEHLGIPEPRLLGDDGRAMVIRLLLDRHHDSLECFGRVARTPGFARDLSRRLGNLFQHHHGPVRLEAAAARSDLPTGLRGKLRDVARIQRAYADWLAAEHLTDQDQLLDLTRVELQHRPPGPHAFDHIWLDGFAEMTPLEIALLAAVVGRSAHATLAFCVDPAGLEVEEASPTHFWSVVAGSFRRCHAALVAATGAPATVEILSREPEHSRFRGHPALAALELSWARSSPHPSTLSDTTGIEVWACQDAHGEAEAAATLIRRHVAGGGRYRDVAVLARHLDLYGEIFQRALRRHGIPCFLDQRHPIRHHPLIELTRSAFRLAINPGNDDDWFAWLKSGLLDLPEWTAERVENSLRSQRWEGNRWLTAHGLLDPDLEARITGPIRAFTRRLGEQPDATTLAGALTALWDELKVDALLESWDRTQSDMFSHRTVLREMQAWLAELCRGFAGLAQPLRAWIPILETAWSGMTAGAIPPALDQVLIGAIDRSRNPELRLVILPGWAADIFPASQPMDSLLSHDEMEQLERAGLPLGPGVISRISHERFYAYIALTRSRDRIAVTTPRFSVAGRPLLPSPFLRFLPSPGTPAIVPHRLGVPLAADIGERPPTEQLEAPMAMAFVGRCFTTSASGLEQVATCPLQHALARTFWVRERQELTLDARREGTVQHELLARFHREVSRTGKRWREVSPTEGRALLDTLARTDTAGPRTPSGAENSFRVEVLIARLRSFLSAWLDFAPSWPLDPAHVELRFSQDSPVPPLNLTTPNGRIVIEGMVDRVDVGPVGPDGVRPLGIIDYKLRGRRLSEPDLLRGLQLQLPLYLLAASQSPGSTHRPVLMVYAPLRAESVRRESRDDGKEACPPVTGYPHRGRLESDWISANGTPDWGVSPFNVRFRKDGQPDRRGEAIGPEDFQGLLKTARTVASTLGESVLGGAFKAVPAVRSGEPACRSCDWRGACRTPAA